MAIRLKDLTSDRDALVETMLAYADRVDSLKETIATLRKLFFSGRSERATIVCVKRFAVRA